jgi:hypothetical protein
MKNIQYIYLSCLFLIFSCQKSDKNEYQKNSLFTIEKAGILSFSVSPSSTNFSKYLQYYVGEDQEYLVTANTNNYTVEVYSFSQKKKIHSYKLPMQGKFGLSYPQIFGFYLFNFDSVFVNSYNRPSLLLLNKNSEVISSKLIDIGSLESQLVPLSRSPNFHYNQKLIVGARPSAPYGKQFWTVPLYYTYNLETGFFDKNTADSFVETEGYYGAFHSHHSYTINKNEGLLIHNITYDKNLYVRNLNTGDIIKEVIAPSQYFAEIPPLMKDGGTAKVGDQDFYITNNSYKSILWDPYRKVYYRFAERGVELKDVNGQFNTWNDKLVSVIILNEDFEILGETDLPQSKYRISNSFVGKEGLYISTSNEKNPDYSEDIMSFDIYELKG